MSTLPAPAPSVNTASRIARGDRAVPADRLPPHSDECEAGLLSCILSKPDLLDEITATPSDLYDLRHAEIFRALIHLRKINQPIDLITVHQFLKDQKRLDQIGGIAYLSEIQDAAPSPANWTNYQETVLEKSELRKIVQTCSGIVSRIYDFEGDIAELKFSVQSDLGEVFGERKINDGETSSWSDLIGFETSTDSNNVIGLYNGKATRWLCRGHSAWLIGPSGVGKSSLLLQFGASFAAGKSLWGITPQKPLRVLIIQAENDRGDMAEMARGIEHGLNLFGNELLQQNIRVRSVTGIIGQQFCVWLRREIESFKAEVVLVDPLLAFGGFDVSRQDQASQFCRVWLDPVLRDTGAVMIAAHHTGKPARRDGRNNVPQTLTEMAYAGIGSSELVNWARAVMLLENHGDNNFMLHFAKRGSRAGATHPNGEPTTMLCLRHATDGNIFWEQIAPVEQEQRDNKAVKNPSKVEAVIAAGIGPVLDSLTEPVSLRELVRRIKNHAATIKHPFTGDGTGRKIIEHFVTVGTIKYCDEKYTKS
jgi:hypothetical protein